MWKKHCQHRCSLASVCMCCAASWPDCILICLSIDVNVRDWSSWFLGIDRGSGTLLYSLHGDGTLLHGWEKSLETNLTLTDANSFSSLDNVYTNVRQCTRLRTNVSDCTLRHQTLELKLSSKRFSQSAIRKFIYFRDY